MLVATTVSAKTVILTDVAEPEPVPGRAVVEVHSVTLCGTDVHIWGDDYPATRLPMVQGHEIGGVLRSVESDPSGETSWRRGDRVAINPMVWCGSCHACNSGRYNACADMSVLGCHRDGGLQELLSVPLDKLHPVPDEVPLGLAALSEPASIAAQAVNRSRAVQGEKVVVLGCGPIGLFATLTLTAVGAEVLAVDRVESRLESARRFGASAVQLVGDAGAYPTTAQQVEIEAWTDGQGPAVVLEASGVPASLEGAVELVAPAGRIVAIGISGRTANLSMTALPYKELDLLGSRNSLRLMPDSLQLLKDNTEVVTSLVTHRFELRDAQEAFRLAAVGGEGVGKIAIDVMSP